MAVILNALRALRPGPAAPRLAAADVDADAALPGEHERIRADIERSCAPLRTSRLRPARRGAWPGSGDVHRLLVEQIGPHEQAEEEELYPALDRLLGGNQPPPP